MNAVFYARVSTEGQTDNTSIKDQIERGQAYALSQGWTLDKIFIDGGESGKSTDRAAFQEMLHYLHNNSVDTLLVFKLDRLSRSLKDILILIDDELDPRNIALQSVTENLNTQSPEGRLFLQMLGSFAEFERERIAERMRMGKLANAKKGGWNGGHIPFGYQKIEGSEYDFDPEPDTCKQVQKIYRLYAAGNGFVMIKKLINTPLSSQSIGNIIQNPFYIGRVQYKGINRANNHPGIVSVRLFNKCQNIRQNKCLA